MARVYGPFRAPGLFGLAERGFYRLVRTNAREEQDWRSYGLTVLVFSVVCRRCSMSSCGCRDICS
jgi:K+-transporting ATPase A subunit